MSSDQVSVAIHDFGGRVDRCCCRTPPASTGTATADRRSHWPTTSRRTRSTTGATATPPVPTTGRSSGSATATTRWQPLERSPRTVGWSGFGHSMGGACLLMAAHRDPGLFDRHRGVRADRVPAPRGRPARRDRERRPDCCHRRPQATGDVRLLRGGDRQLRLQAAADGVRPRRRSASYVAHGFRPSPEGVHLKCEPEPRPGRSPPAAAHTTWATPAGDHDTGGRSLAGQVDEFGRRRSPRRWPSGCRTRRTCRRDEWTTSADHRSGAMAALIIGDASAEPASSRSTVL